MNKTAALIIAIGMILMGVCVKQGLEKGLSDERVDRKSVV